MSSWKERFEWEEKNDLLKLQLQVLFEFFQAGLITEEEHTENRRYVLEQWRALVMYYMGTPNPSLQPPPSFDDSRMFDDPPQQVAPMADNDEIQEIDTPPRRRRLEILDDMPPSPPRKRGRRQGQNDDASSSDDNVGRVPKRRRRFLPAGTLGNQGARSQLPAAETGDLSRGGSKRPVSSSSKSKSSSSRPTDDLNLSDCRRIAASSSSSSSTALVPVPASAQAVRDAIAMLSGSSEGSRPGTGGKSASSRSSAGTPPRKLWSPIVHVGQNMKGAATLSDTMDWDQVIAAITRAAGLPEDTVFVFLKKNRKKLAKSDFNSLNQVSIEFLKSLNKDTIHIEVVGEEEEQEEEEDEPSEDD